MHCSTHQRFCTQFTPAMRQTFTRTHGRRDIDNAYPQLLFRSWRIVSTHVFFQPCCQSVAHSLLSLSREKKGLEFLFCCFCCCCFHTRSLYAQGGSKGQKVFTACLFTHTVTLARSSFVHCTHITPKSHITNKSTACPQVQPIIIDIESGHTAQT